MTTALFQEPNVQPVVETQEDPDAPTVEAPYGWTKDPVTGERRPKKTAGRRPKGTPVPYDAPTAGTPPLEELKARATERPARAEDVAPAPAPAKHTFSIGKKTPKAPEPIPPFRAGPIAKSINKTYRRAGRIVKIWDPEVGAAIIACTRKDEDEEDDLTVGEAWEELARINPRIRAFLTRFITTSALGSLFVAHAPILLAICLKEGIRSRIPFLRIANAFLSDDDDLGEEFPSDLAQSLGGIGPADLAQMMEMAQAMMGQMAGGVSRGMNDVRDVQEAG